MRRKSLVLLAVLAVLFSSMVSYANAGKIKEYSAEQVAITPDGKIQETVKFYVAPDRVRMEPSSKKGKDSPVMIFRQDKGIIWILNTAEKKYLENKLNEEEMAQTLKKVPQNVKETDLGTEKVNGYKCSKKRVEYTASFMGIKKTSTSTVWVSDQLDFPLRTEGEDGNITELRNINKGKQSNKLFELPDGYTRMKMFDQLGGDKGGLPFKLPFGK